MSILQTLSNLFDLAPPMQPCLPDDGLRVINHGEIQKKYKFVSLSNPDLISAAVAQRTRRQMIRETNIRKWS